MYQPNTHTQASPSNRNTLPTLTVIGLMSGTSVDSIDAACIRVRMGRDPLCLAEFSILGTATLDLDPALREALLSTMSAPEVPLEALCRLKTDVGVCFAQAANMLIEQLKPQDIAVDLIASHGQTLYHVPPTKGQLGSTLQIGEPAVIAEQTGIEVAADFRPGDMAAGGHGAPLVPFADMLLFQDKSIPRAVQNIGGIANLTALPALSDESQPIMAFDTGPGNMMIDALMEALFGAPFDADGQVAGEGHIHQPMLDAMLANPYFNELPPKSTGRELFGKPYALTLLEQWRNQVSSEGIIATVTYFTAFTIAEAYKTFVLPKIPVQEIVLGGGGVMNQTLVRHLEDLLAPHGIQLKPHEAFGIPSKYKEAIAFALLGYARKTGIPSNIPSCTGASHPVILGGLWKPYHKLTKYL